MFRMNFVEPKNLKGKKTDDIVGNKSDSNKKPIESLSLGKLEKLARKAGRTIGEQVIEALVKKYRDNNQVRTSVKNSLENLKELDNRVGQLAAQALEDLENAETKKKENMNLSGKAFVNRESLKSKPKVEPPKGNKNKRRGKKKK